MSSAVASIDSISPCASLLIIFGIGDVGLIDASITTYPQKDIWIVSYDEVVPDRTWPERTRIAKVTRWEDMQNWIMSTFGDHNDIIRLGGVDLLDSDGMSAAAQLLRDNLRTRTTAMLADRVWALGNDCNDSFTGLWHSALNAKVILPGPSIGDLAGSLGVIPVISIGAGPSIADHIDELRALQDRCILVACDSVCPGLVKAGVIPHFVTPQERSRDQSQFVKCLEGTRAIFAGLPVCHPDTLKPFGDRAIYLHCMDKLYDWLEPNDNRRCFTGSSTGVLSFFVAASLTRGPVYLVGHDLAKEDGKTHWNDAAFAGEAFAKEAGNAGGIGANGYEERLIPGNSGKMLTSIMWWDNFRSEISSQAALIPGRVFNVNAHDGKYAVIEHTLPAPLPKPEDLPVLPPLVIGRPHEARYADWKTRVQSLGADGRKLIDGLASVRMQIALMRQKPPNEWDIDALMAKITPESHVGVGNVAAFQYFLRSAIYNEQVRASGRARTFTDRTSAYWSTMQSLDGLADALGNITSHLQGLLEKAKDL